MIGNPKKQENEISSFIEGERIKLLTKVPIFKEPLLVEVRGSQIALTKREAQFISALCKRCLKRRFPSKLKLRSLFTFGLVRARNGFTVPCCSDGIARRAEERAATPSAFDATSSISTQQSSPSRYFLADLHQCLMVVNGPNLRPTEHIDLKLGLQRPQQDAD